MRGKSVGNLGDTFFENDAPLGKRLKIWHRGAGRVVNLERIGPNGIQRDEHYIHPFLPDRQLNAGWLFFSPARECHRAEKDTYIYGGNKKTL